MIAALVLLAATAVADVEAGRRLYEEGLGAGGAPVEAVVGETVLPASSVPCAGCHGEDGRGRAEGAVVPPSLRWSELTRPDGHVHPQGRRHPAFDPPSLRRAIVEGIDPAGHRLAPAMPRYRLSRADLDALVAWLKKLERRHEPGVGDGALRVATVVPASGPLASAGAAMLGLLRATLADAGRVHGRRVELAVVAFGPEGAVPAVRRLVAEGPPFAFVGGLAPGDEEALGAFLAAEAIPWIGPIAAPAAIRARPERPVFFLRPGLEEEALALSAFAARRPDLRGRPVAVVHPEGEAGAAGAAREALRLLGVEAIVVRSGPGAREATARIRTAGAVIFLGEADGLVGLAGTLGASPPLLLASGALGARAAARLPDEFAGRLFLAYPALPGDGGPAAATRFRRLARAAGVGRADGAIATWTLAAAEVLAEGLRRAGADPSRARLIAALEDLHAFPAGPLPPIGFGPGQRVGLRGAYVVAVEEDGRFRPTGPWIPAEGRPTAR